MNDKIIFYSKPFPSVKSYKQMIDCAAEYGILAVECLNKFEFETPDISVAKELKSYADGKGIKFACFSVYVDLTSDDMNKKIETVKKYAQVAAILGSPYLHHTITPDFLNSQNILSFKDEHFNKGIVAVREIYDYAQSLGIKTIYENQGFIFNGVDTFSKFLKMVDRDVGVIADFGNIYQTKNNIEEFISAFKYQICHVHLKDIVLTDTNIYGIGWPTLTNKYVTEVEPGTGIIDFKKSFKILKDAGYNGCFALECTLKSDDKDLMTALLDRITELLDV